MQHKICVICQKSFIDKHSLNTVRGRNSKYCSLACRDEGQRRKSRERQFERFMLRVNKQENGCWIWDKPIKGLGYGRFTLDNKNKGAHRVSWILHFGTIPEGKYICHKCDIKVCVNPSHLFLGTSAENTIDAAQKDIMYVTKKKLDREKVLFIRNSKLRSGELAKMFGVCRDHISRVRHYKKRVHII